MLSENVSNMNIYRKIRNVRIENSKHAEKFLLSKMNFIILMLKYVCITFVHK